MKKLRFISVIPIVLTLASCKPELIDKRIPESIAAVAPIAGIVHDTAFKELIKSQLKFYKGITNPEGIREVLKDNKISPLEYRMYPSYFGYMNPLDFERHFLLLKYRARWLDKRYGWRNLPKAEQLGYLAEGIKAAMGAGPLNLALALADHCSDAKTTCISTAMIKTMAMHVTCALADVTILAGLACHGVVSMIYVAETNKCEDAYNTCKKQVLN